MKFCSEGRDLLKRGLYGEEYPGYQSLKIEMKGKLGRGRERRKEERNFLSFYFFFFYSLALVPKVRETIIGEGG